MPNYEPALDLHIFHVSEGLGNACLLELPDESCAIIDWGTQRSEALEAAVKLINRRTVRFIAATHAHADHTLGIAKLLDRFKETGIVVERFVYPASTLHRAHAHLTQARLRARDRGIAMSAIAVDDFGDSPSPREPPFLAWAEKPAWELRVLSPSQSRVSEVELRALEAGNVPGNETSLVILFRFLGEGAETSYGRVLLPGDATPATLRFARRTAESFHQLRLDNQAFVVPHHGSARNLPSWLGDHLHGIAVVSAPSNSRHHPSTEALTRLSQRTCRGTTPRLFCTSYAKACADTFGPHAHGAQRSLIRPGRCFGDLTIRVPRNGPAMLLRSSVSGELRRRFGFCGNPDQGI